jgi:hypothetical protein
MRAVLKVFGVLDRKVWVADSFEGLPVPPTARYPQQDLGDQHHTFKALAVSLETVQKNFRKYDLLDAASTHRCTTSTGSALTGVLRCQAPQVRLCSPSWRCAPAERMRRAQAVASRERFCVCAM